MATTCLALLIAMVALGWLDQWSFRERMSDDAMTRARIIGKSSVGALRAWNSNSAEEVLRALNADPHLGAAAIYDTHGVALARFARNDWFVPLPPRPVVDSATFKEDYLQVSHSVKLDGMRLGTVLLQFDLEELRVRRNSGLTVFTGVLLAVVGFGFLITTRLTRFVSRPILELSNSARRVASEKNFTVRVVKENEDELGQLVDGFNEMLGQIEVRDLALREAAAELETRVVLRTTELFEANELLKTEVESSKRARAESDALREKLQVAYERLQRESDDRVAAQEALSRSEERFSKAFRASPVPLAIITRGSREFVDVNDRFAELADRQRDEIIGAQMFDLPLWSVPEIRARLEQLLADGQPLRNWDCRIADGTDAMRSALLSAESFQLGSEPCILLMTEDISERVNLEGQLRQAQKMDAIGQLASGVAHDFNNLLTIIQGYTQVVLAMQPAGSISRDALEKVTCASQRAAQLTGQLLTFSRKQIAQPTPLDINQIVTNVTGMLEPLLGEHVRLKWNPKPKLPSIEGDAVMLEQVLVNLAVNARDAMPRGGDLIVSTFSCEIDTTYLQYRPQARPGRFVCLQVSDSGCGMDPATLERIFEPFFTTKGVGKGTGLGLATVYGIVKQHRGWVEVVSQVGVGTTFKIFLPAADVPTTQTDSVTDDGRVRGGHERILVVEDEPALRELVTNILREYGYEVIEASHGKEAVHVWRETDRKPTMLLTDMMMPEGMTGWELAERLRGEAPGLKVVYTSGYSTELFGGHLKLHDRANFLPKPFHPRTLAKTVRHCLDN